MQLKNACAKNIIFPIAIGEIKEGNFENCAISFTPLIYILWECGSILCMSIEPHPYEIYRGYPAKRALSAMRKHGG